MENVKKKALKPFSSLKGSVKSKKNRPVSIKEMDQAIRKKAQRNASTIGLDTNSQSRPSP